VKLLRGVVPLDERRAAAVSNYRAKMARDGVKDEVADARAEAYAGRLLSQRAETIARTEGFRAMSEGRLDLWRELADDQVVPRERVVRRWMTARDERVDDICEALDNTTTDLDGDFGGISAPPAHPSCRCTDVITVEGY
jgi:hypothetical protein